jgi:hypothetical protein
MSAVPTSLQDEETLAPKDRLDWGGLYSWLQA